MRIFVFKQKIKVYYATVLNLQYFGFVLIPNNT